MEEKKINDMRGRFVLYEGGIFRVKSGPIYLTDGTLQPFLKLSEHIFVQADRVELINETDIYKILPL